MRIEALPPGEAEGAILVHGVRAAGRMLKKGRTLGQSDIAALKEAGVTRVMVARLEAGDVGEDEAAARIARALADKTLRVGAAFAGRANLYAREAGLVLLAPAAIDAANLVDEAITMATLAPYAHVAAGDMVATVKIIPYAAPNAALDSVTRIAGSAPISVAAFRPMNTALITTHLPDRKPGALDNKTKAALEARLAPLGGTVIFEKHCPHDAIAVTAALREAITSGACMVFVMGASAISDRRDVVPAGIVGAGGVIKHYGMPVDPGNLLLLAELDGKAVIGLPGCARSPKLNGFDFVLQRLFAQLPVTREDIMAMGVGGLLKEIPSRMQPRALEETLAVPRAPRIGGVVLAAGLSSRMGSNKLLAPWHGEPLLRRSVAAVLQSEARPVIIVTGHETKRIEAALADLDVTFVHNPNYAEGLSTSLSAGIKAVPANCDGALVLLGDMPELSSNLLDRMIAAFSPVDSRAICVASSNGKRGNPVLWARRFFPEIEGLSGDSGAKHLIGEHEDTVCEIEGDNSVLTDVDTPEALAALRSRAPAKALT